MAKTTEGKQEQQTEKGHNLKNSRYWENTTPDEGMATPKDEKKVPDARNPKRLKELH